VCLLVCALMAFLAVSCQMLPPKPEMVFMLYRDRMKAENLKEARELLSDESRGLAENLSSQFKLTQPPENLALMNALDPVAAPTVTKSSDALVLLQVRTLKGDLRTISLVRRNTDSPWKIDLTAELQAFQAFLQARAALDTLREQAGEYAATWKAFDKRIGEIGIAGPSPEKPEPLVAPVKKPKDKPKPVKQQRKPR
jgi:hypothetical protein